VDENNLVWSWGQDTYGQLGNGSPTTNQHEPVAVHGEGDSGVLEDIIAVSGGEWHSMALEAYSEGGHVFTFGDDTDGQLGDGNGSGHTGSKNYPVKVLKG